jgi:hypothetical protein
VMLGVACKFLRERNEFTPLARLTTRRLGHEPFMIAYAASDRNLS